jgi:nitrogen-specific signal transduction histidine kinase
VDESHDHIDALAHDLNNLLTTIVGGADLLLQSLPEGQERQDAEEIRDAGRRAADLVRRLPNVSSEDDHRFA